MKPIHKTHILTLICIVLSIFLLRYATSMLLVHFIPSYYFPKGSPEFQIKPSGFIENDPIKTSLPDLGLRWDSGFYMGIAQNGYTEKQFSTENYENWAFYPLFSYLVSFFTNIVSSTNNTNATFIIGIVLSNIFLVLSLISLWCLLEELGYDEKVKKFPLVFLLAFPAAYFFNMFYTESLYLLLSTLFFLFLFKRKFVYSFILLSLILVTKVNAVLLIPPFLFYIYSLKKELGVKKALTLIGSSGLAFIPMFLHHLHIKSLTKDFFAPFKIQAAWNNKGLFPLAYFKMYFRDARYLINPGQLFNLVFLILAIYICIKFVLLSKEKNKLPKKIEKNTLAIYAILSLTLITSLPNGSSIMRYLLVIFPLFILPLDIVKKQKWESPITYAVLYIFATLQMLFFAFFILNAPVYSY